MRRFVWPVSECPQESRPVKAPELLLCSTRSSPASLRQSALTWSDEKGVENQIIKQHTLAVMVIPVSGNQTVTPAALFGRCPPVTNRLQRRQGQHDGGLARFLHGPVYPTEQLQINTITISSDKSRFGCWTQQVGRLTEHQQ